MTAITCGRVRDHLAMFVDGELRGPEVLSIGHHLESCDECGREAQALRGLGNRLRDASAARTLPADDLAGLADGVISRVRAEQQQSWLAAIGRGFEDMHWVLAGAGAVIAAVVSAVAVYLVITTGVPERSDSLAAALQPPPADIELVSNAAGTQSRADLIQAITESFGDDVFVGSDFRVENLDRFPKASRQNLETYVSELAKFQMLSRPGAVAPHGLLLIRVHVKTS